MGMSEEERREFREALATCNAAVYLQDLQNYRDPAGESADRSGGISDDLSDYRVT